MTEIKKWGGKRENSGRRDHGYKQFTNARLEPDLIDWMKSEKAKYPSWNMFFREIKKRYEKNTS
jgi:hypothetical protein